MSRQSVGRMHRDRVISLRARLGNSGSKMIMYLQHISTAAWPPAADKKLLIQI
jgi:hypothetical protein